VSTPEKPFTEECVKGGCRTPVSEKKKRELYKKEGEGRGKRKEGLADARAGT